MRSDRRGVVRYYRSLCGRDAQANHSRWGEAASGLHEERLAAVADALTRRGARSVLDLGCGDGKLIERLAAQPRFIRLVGVDISSDAIATARSRLDLAPNASELRVTLQQGSFMEPSREMTGFDAAVLLETIEHIEPGLLSLVERAVFGCYRPACVLVTTPNHEYNRLHGLPPGVFRHPDHRFEWKRSKFREWAGGVAARNGYAVTFEDVGERDAIFGASTQMACFTLQHDSSSAAADAESAVRPGVMTPQRGRRCSISGAL